MDFKLASENEVHVRVCAVLSYEDVLLLAVL